MDDLPTLPRYPALGILLRLVTQQWANAVDASLREAGFDDIRAPHANVFPFVPPEGIQLSRLASLAHVRKQTMVQTIDEMERAGYVQRRADPRDRRVRLVFVTPRGQALQAVAMEAARRVMARWAELTSPDEIVALSRSLERMLERLGESPDSDR